MIRIHIVGIIILASVISAQADVSVLSMKDAVSMALEKNNRIKGAQFRSRAASYGVKSATAGYLPVISLEETLIATNSPTNAFIMKLDEGRFTPADFATADSVNNPGTSHDFKTALSIRQPLFVPSLSPRRELALKEAERSDLELESTRQGVAFAVFQTYLEVLKAEAQLKSADKSVTEARESMRLAGVRTSAGIGLKSDELRSRTHLSQIEQQVISAHNNLMLAKMKLATLLGLPEESEFILSSSPERIPVPSLTEQIIGSALENRVEMRQANVDIGSSGAALKLAGSEYLPSVNAFASYQLNAKDAPFTSDNDAWNAGVSLTWNIFDGFHRYSEKHRAASGLSAAREMQEAATREIRYQVRESYVRRTEAGKRLEVARHALLDAEETVRLLARRYENSLATMVELLDAQNMLNQSRSSLVEAEADYTLAGGRVYFMTGTFVKEILK